MWACRLPVHIGSFGNYEFAEDFCRPAVFCRTDSVVHSYRGYPIFKRLHKILRHSPLVCSCDFGYDDSTEKKTEGNLVCSIYWSATMRRISSRL